MKTLKNDKNEIVIISGKGAGPGHVERYEGCGSDRALKARLTRERCSGDRWACALIYSHDNEYGRVGINFETGEYETYPSEEDIN